MTQNPSPKLRTTSWVTGQSGNPAGKPLGTRSAFSKAFVADLTVAWQEHGVGVLQKVARSDPTRFLGVCASVLPKDVAVSIQEQTPGNLDPQDWAIVMELLQAVKETVPNAADRRPGERSCRLRAMRSDPRAPRRSTTVRKTVSIAAPIAGQKSRVYHSLSISTV